MTFGVMGASFGENLQGIPATMQIPRPLLQQCLSGPRGLCVLMSVFNIITAIISQDSSEKQNQRETDSYGGGEREITGIGSHDDGGREVLRSAVCKLEAQGCR